MFSEAEKSVAGVDEAKNAAEGVNVAGQGADVVGERE